MSGGRWKGINEADRAAFARDGVVCLRNVLSADEVRALREAVTCQIDRLGTSQTGYDFEALARAVWNPEVQIETGAATRFDMSSLRELVASDPAARPLLEGAGPSEPGLFFYDAAGWRQDARIQDVAFHSALPEIAADLLQAKRVHFWEDTTFAKAPHTRQKTAFHQDLSYFQISGDQCLIAWIPLDPAGLWNGVTQYVRGSHKWGEVYAPNIFLSQTPFPGADGPRCPDIEADPDAFDLVAFDVMPGDVILHHVLTVHGAGGNPSDRWRRAVSFRYCGEAVRYLERKGALPQPGGPRALADGQPLPSSIYPVVWPKRAGRASSPPAHD